MWAFICIESSCRKEWYFFSVGLTKWLRVEAGGRLGISLIVAASGDLVDNDALMPRLTGKV